MTEPTPKFCKDCKFAKRQGFFIFPFPWDLAKCLHPLAQERDGDYLTSGEVGVRNAKYAANFRDFGTCGHDAKLFTPKHGATP